MRHSAEKKIIPYHSWNSVFAMSFEALSYMMTWSQHMCFENKGIYFPHSRSCLACQYSHWRKQLLKIFLWKLHSSIPWQIWSPMTSMTPSLPTHQSYKSNKQPSKQPTWFKQSGNEVPHIHLLPPKHAKATRCNTVAIYGGHWGDQTHCLLGTYYMGWHERALAAWLDRTWTPGHSAICRCGFLWASRGNYPGHLRAFIP